ncbi:hypothetical protein K2173_000384 [Erythroxylum novogranatense]|uniref:Uncharacterized protein n=1 Tax=Erythroxylum novogranatense TaxID=1862640 RepID=A0AAV8SX17_9ROSI|nr:hypothetical protein K2173_000384 [Erythroxylum novogranatense]
MGMVVVISLPLILFGVVLGLGCYFLGRAKARKDLRTNPEVFGTPAPPTGATYSVPPPLFKPDNSSNV